MSQRRGRKALRLNSGVRPVFEHPAYVVLELPEPIGSRVLKIRERYDQRLASFPAEITVAGSSGIGTIAPGQESLTVFHALEQLASQQAPITTHFTGISRFTSGPVQWLQPADPAPFISLQQALTACGVQFLPHKFPYTPHCTLCACHLTPDATESLLRESFPQDSFVLSTLALYKVVQGQATLIKRFHLGARA